MTGPRASEDDSADAGRRTARAEITERLRRKNVVVRGQDDDEALVRLLDATEAFERKVARLGGDLMMDEPPAGERGRPDHDGFVLPARAADESAEAYAARVTDATSRLRR